MKTKITSLKVNTILRPTEAGEDSDEDNGEPERRNFFVDVRKQILLDGNKHFVNYSLVYC